MQRRPAIQAVAWTTAAALPAAWAVCQFARSVGALGVTDALLQSAAIAIAVAAFQGGLILAPLAVRRRRGARLYAAALTLPTLVGLIYLGLSLGNRYQAWRTPSDRAVWAIQVATIALGLLAHAAVYVLLLAPRQARPWVRAHAPRVAAG